MNDSEKRHKLRVGKITAVGFVDRGANQLADISIIKRADPHLEETSGSEKLLAKLAVQPTLMVYTMAYTDG